MISESRSSHVARTLMRPHVRLIVRHTNSLPVVAAQFWPLTSFTPQSRCYSHAASTPAAPLISFTVTSLIFNTVYLCLLLTCFVCLCLLFVFSITRIGSLSTPITTALHVNSLSSRYLGALSLRGFCTIGVAPSCFSDNDDVFPTIGSDVDAFWASFGVACVTVGGELSRPGFSVQSRLPSTVARLKRRISPGMTPCIRNGRRTVSPAVTRYGLP